MKSYSNKTKLIASAVILIVFFIAGYFLYPREAATPEYIFDKSYNISLKDVDAAGKPLPFKHNKKTDKLFNLDREPGNGDTAKKNGKDITGIDLKKLFSEGLINSHTTLKYFKHLESLFGKSSTLADHFAKVRAYLFSHFPASDARILFDTYQKYLQCEMDLITNGEYKNLSMSVKSPEDAIAVLRRIQEFRRERLGTELADKLFGADVKAKEYALRRAAIVNNSALYGDEKEKMIKKLDQDMWGKEANAVEQHQNPYNRYQEKLKLYKKDLADAATAEERKEKIESFRKEFLPPDVVKKFDEIDRQLVQEKNNEKNYRAEEKTLASDDKLTEKEKKAKTTKLQNKFFGPQAVEFRRREAIRTGRKDFIKSVEAKVEAKKEAAQNAANSE